MGKILYDVASHLKSTFRGSVIGLCAAGAAVETYIIKDYKTFHDGKIYDYFALLYAAFLLTCIIQGVLFILTTITILPKGLKFVLEVIGDFVCAGLLILAAILTASNCGTGLGKECFLNSTRVPTWLALAAGVLNALVLVLTGMKK